MALSWRAVAIYKTICFQITASIGISLYQRDYKDVMELFNEADEALYMAKRAGKHCYRIIPTENGGKSTKKASAG